MARTFSNTNYYARSIACTVTLTTSPEYNDFVSETEEEILMQMYKLIAGTTGYEVLLTRSQCEHMLSLWGEQYDINTCTPATPISSPSGYTTIELVYMAATESATA